MRGWSERIKIVSEPRGYAYRAGELLVKRSSTEEDQRTAVELLGYTVAPGRKDEFIAGDSWVPSGTDYWKVPDYQGDVPSAVRRLRGAGLTAQPNHVFFADSGPHANPAYANPAYANPAYANPAYANPAYANPAYANPAYANPAYANPTSPMETVGHQAGQAPASRVYPNPVVARLFYSDGDALRYELTGERPSNAVPLYPQQSVALPTNACWGGDGIRVAVVDTGWPPNPVDLESWYPEGGVKAAGAGGQATLGARPESTDIPDFEGRSGDPEAYYLDPVAGHGMFIAGLLRRYAPGVQVKVEKALSTYGDGDEDTIATKIENLVEGDDPPHIINLSFGAYTLDEPNRLSLAIKAAIRSNIVVVASAGNDGISRKQYPAAFEGVVSVGAIGPNGPAPFSNWGDWVRASAPGVDLASTFWTFDGKAVAIAGADRDQFDGWALWSGTSFAAPIVAASIVQTMLASRASPSTATLTAYDATDLVIDYPGLHRLPNYGTVINPAPGIPNL